MAEDNTRTTEGEGKLINHISFHCRTFNTLTPLLLFSGQRKYTIERNSRIIFFIVIKHVFPDYQLNSRERKYPVDVCSSLPILLDTGSY